MTRLLMPYGSKRYERLVFKKTDVGKRAQNLRDSVVTLEELGLRIVRLNEDES